MPGLLEVALVAVIAFVTFGPRKRAPKVALDRRRAAWTWVATIALPAVCVGAAAAHEGLAPAAAVRLAVAAAAASAVALRVAERIRATAP